MNITQEKQACYYKQVFNAVYGYVALLLDMLQVCTMVSSDQMYSWNPRKLPQRCEGIRGSLWWSKSKTERKRCISDKAFLPTGAKTVVAVNWFWTSDHSALPWPYCHCVLGKQTNMILLQHNHLRSSFTSGKNIVQLHLAREFPSCFTQAFCSCMWYSLFAMIVLLLRDCWHALVTCGGLVLALVRRFQQLLLFIDSSIDSSSEVM